MTANHAAANPAIASLLQSSVLVGRVAELGSLGRFTRHNMKHTFTITIVALAVGTLLLCSCSTEHSQTKPTDGLTQETIDSAVRDRNNWNDAPMDATKRYRRVSP
jgi:hypothetical protein